MNLIRSAWLAAVLASFVAAQDAAAGGLDKIKSLQQQFSELRQKVQQDFAGLEQLPEKEREAAGDRIYSEFQEKVAAIADQYVGIATADQGEVGLAACRAALGIQLTKAQRASIVETLSAHHANGAGIVELLPSLRHHSGKTVDALLKKVIADNPARQAKGAASYVLAQRAKEEDRAPALEAVLKDYGDLEIGGEKLGPMLERTLYALRNLKIGGTPPEIEGKDMDGVPFKLSDYKGKVVVLDFWGFW